MILAYILQLVVTLESNLYFELVCLKIVIKPVVVHIFNPNIWELRQTDLSFRPSLSTEKIPGQSGPHRNHVLKKRKEKEKKTLSSEINRSRHGGTWWYMVVHAHTSSTSLGDIATPHLFG